MPQEQREAAPGLDKRVRKDGSIRCYWRAERRYAEAGFEPRVVRLVGDWASESERPRIIDQCHRLQAQMLASVDGDKYRSAAAAGTIEWLCDLYQRHPSSPYRTRRHDTQLFMDKYIGMVRRTVGKRRADSITGVDVRKWYANWQTGGDKPRVRTARACIQALRTVAAFGCEFKNRGAQELRGVLSAMRFEGTGKRRQAMTAEQVEATCREARKQGRPSIARALALQFWTALRQKDVIGEWVYGRDTFGSSVSVRTGNRLRDRPTVRTPRIQKIWQTGLEWERHLTRSLQLSKPTSKSNGKVTVEYDLTLFPAVVEQFDDVAVEARTGPVIVNEVTGQPWTRQAFVRAFRRAADAAGVPRDVWNMDSRAGAVTDALGAGAAPSDVMKAAGHTQLQTTLGYHRGSAEQTERVAKLRVGRDRRVK